MRYLSVIQHTHSDWLGLIEDHLEGRGIRFGYARPFATGGTLPDVETIGDGLILLAGGPWGAAPGPRQLPTLDAEVRLARACLMLGKSVLGFGLGAQILSLAGEGSVVAEDLRFEVGDAHRTRPEALGGFLPEHYPNVVYMRDRPVPPEYADILARDTAGAPALFQIGSNAFGFTGHPGLKRAMIEDLVMEFDESPADAGAGLDRITALGSAIEDALVPIMTGVVQATGWMRD
ncbi:MAG: hypothetical protein KDJ41_08685 [Hyphomicrobiaceae bacterium]|nr:hypothetical protein [Hyphomicrobiaceae bacterium]